MSKEYSLYLKNKSYNCNSPFPVFWFSIMHSSDNLPPQIEEIPCRCIVMQHCGNQLPRTLVRSIPSVQTPVTVHALCFSIDASIHSSAQQVRVRISRDVDFSEIRASNARFPRRHLLLLMRGAAGRIHHAQHVVNFIQQVGGLKRRSREGWNGLGLKRINFFGPWDTIESFGDSTDLVYGPLRPQMTSLSPDGQWCPVVSGPLVV